MLNYRLEKERFLNESPDYIDDPPGTSDSRESTSSAVDRQQRVEEPDPELKKHNNEARREVREFNEDCQDVVEYILEGKYVEWLYMIYLKKEYSQM